jgi:hypothetical protein
MAIAFALLVSADPLVIQQFSVALRELFISVEICQEVPVSIRLLTERKFDAVLIDLQLGAESGMILDLVRLSAFNRTAVTFAIGGCDSDAATAFRKKSGFIFERPLSAQSIRRILRSSYGLILRERRRYFRFPVTIPVTIRRQGMPEIRCYSVNISEGGMAVSTSVTLPAGEDVKVEFTLPNQKKPLVAQSRICWDKAGRLGIRFMSFPAERKSEIQSWLLERQEEMLPVFATSKVQDTQRSFAAAVDDTNWDKTMGKPKLRSSANGLGE